MKYLVCCGISAKAATVGPYSFSRRRFRRLFNPTLSLKSSRRIVELVVFSSYRRYFSYFFTDFLILKMTTYVDFLLSGKLLASVHPFNDGSPSHHGGRHGVV